MIEIMIQFIPLALAAVSPILILIVILLIGTEDGLRKASAFTLGKYLVYLGWGVLFLVLMDWIGSAGGVDTPTMPAAMMVLLGILLLVLAGSCLLGEDDPDDVPPKWMTQLDQQRPAALFGIGALLSVVQIRFVLLVAAGVSIMMESELSSIQSIVLLLILAFCLVWSLLLPIIIYVLMGDRGSQAIGSMKGWLTRNQRWINFGVLLFIGVVLVFKGLTSLGVFES